MKELLIFIMATIGLTWAITRGGIFQWLREGVSKINNKRETKVSWFFNEVLNCYKCQGLWSASFCYAMQYYKVDIILYGLSGIFICWMAFDFNAFLNKR